LRANSDDFNDEEKDEEAIEEEAEDCEEDDACAGASPTAKK
jgi:hypothetical protein